MGIHGSSLLVGATGITIVGGSAVTMKSDAGKPNGIHVVDTSVSNLAVRPSSTFTSKAPSYTNGQVTKGKRDITHIRPKILSTGENIGQSVRISFEITHEITAAELLELKLQAVQHIMDAEYDDFYNYGVIV